jgi:hypothetical protein
VALLSHVLKQPGCKRVVILAHSLGTSVAYDTLLAAIHVNRSVNMQDPTTGKIDLTKISHLVTLASPVDKISYFFESFRSSVRRYRKIYNQLRGDIGGPPFTRTGGQPKIHWVNIWDEADIISGPVQSPSAETGVKARVDNVHVNNLAYLNPGTAHGAYFDNRSVIKMLFDIVFLNRGAYDSKSLPMKMNAQGKPDGLDYRAADFGPGTGRGTWTNALRAGTVAPWLWLAYLGAMAAGFQAHWMMALALLVTAWPVLALLKRVTRWNGQTDPLE